MKQFIGILSLCLVFSYSSAQEDTTTYAEKQIYVVTTTNGKEYIGHVISDDGRELLLMTEKIGKIYIDKSKIKSMVKNVDQSLIKNDEYWFQGPFTTRYTFTTNALPIKKYDNYALVRLMGPEVQFALTDNFSMGFMSTWALSPLILSFKYSFKTKNELLNFSIGTLTGSSGYLNSFASFGSLHWGNVTYGSRKSNITFSGGYAYLRVDLTDKIEKEGVYVNSSPKYARGLTPDFKGPVFSVAGIHKIGPKSSFIFDSMFGVFDEIIVKRKNETINNDEVITVFNSHYLNFALIIMPGLRFQTEDKNAFQISIAGVSVFEQGYARSFPFPMFSWYVRL
jgi:hypothetical protein